MHTSVYADGVSLYRNIESKGGGTGGARGAIAPPLFTDHLKNDILFDYSDTENCY